MLQSITLEQVEVLRDGAAAQYGSDAIAGVINFRLKDAAEGGSEVKSGQFYEGDGDLRQVSGNVGLPFTDKGFANISGEFKQADPTSRSVQRDDAAASAAAGNPFIENPAQVWGSPEFKRDVEGGFYYRHPTTRSDIYSNDEGKSLLIFSYSLSVAGGIEYRDETVEIYAGDAASFEVGPLTYQGFGIVKVTYVTSQLHSALQV